MSNSDGRDVHARAAPATITAGISITGDVACSTDLQIAGRVQGDVRCSTVFVDEGGSVAGGIYAERVRVSGSVEGTIESGDLAVEPGGRVSGNVSYARLKVSAGAVVEGSFKHRGSDASAPVPVPDTGLKLVDAPDHANPRRVYVD